MIKSIAYSVLVVVLGIVGLVGYFIFGIHRSIGRLDSMPQSPTNFKPAALELIKLCQSEPTFYSEDSVDYLCPFDPVYAPPSVARLSPENIHVEPGRAVVTWGGGFYHCG